MKAPQNGCSAAGTALSYQQSALVPLFPTHSGSHPALVGHQSWFRRL